MDKLFQHPFFEETNKILEKQENEAYKNRLQESNNRHLKVSQDYLTVSHVDASTLQTDAVNFLNFLILELTS